jgi:hypothetical protein
MKAIAAVVLALFVTTAHAETDVLLMGHSWHFGPNSEGLNGDNYGAGLEYRSDRGWFVGGLAYRDSYRKQAYAGYVGYQYEVFQRGNWGAFVAVRAGYINGSGFHGAMVLPTVGVKYGRFAAEVLYIPRVGGHTTNVIGLFGRIAF